MAPIKKRRRDSEPVEADGTSPVKAGEPDSSPPAKKQQQRRSLFVRSLPASATTETLVAYFSQSYPIKHATAVMDPATKNCKGFGFVTFADADDAQRALVEFNGSTFEGRKMKIEIAEPRSRDVEDAVPGAVAAGQAKPRSVPSAKALEAKAQRVQAKEEARAAPRLIVRNLPWTIKKPEQLADLFRSYGKIKHVVLPSKTPGRMSGFGFVVLRGKPNAEKAIQGVNGKELDGRTLAVDWAVEKEVWEKENKPAEAETAVDGADEVKPDEEHGSVDSHIYPGEDDEDDNAASDDEDDENLSELDEDMYDDDEDDDNSDFPAQLTDNSATLFIRNLPFTTLDEDLKEHFTTFGLIRYARVVMDPSTERPRGTGFVCFVKAEEAMQCLREAPKPFQAPSSKANGSGKSKTEIPGPSILQNEADDPSGKYTIQGRVLQLSKAVDKTEATRLTEDGISRRGERDKDKRRLYLLSEGTISTSAPMYSLLSPQEISMREASAKQRQQLIKTNPSLHLSLTRLSIRNIPRSITSKDLKALAREAVVGFAKDVAAGKRTRLSREELARGGDAMIEAEKARKKSGKGIVKQAKVVFEGTTGGKIAEGTGAGRSRGYGFVEYYTHRSALMGLRWLNGHVIDYQTKETGGKKGKKEGREELAERKKRMIVEFAIENAQVVKRRDERETKIREGPRQERRGRGGKGGEDLFTTVDVAGKGAAAAKKSGKGDEKVIDKSEADKLAERQRIIGRKRMMRRKRAGGPK